MMNQKVKELVEWVDKELRCQMITIGTCIEDAKTGQMWAFDSERLTKIILSHPDLALIDRSHKLPKFDYGDCQDVAHHVVAKMLSHGYQPIIPLAEALKEVEG